MWARGSCPELFSCSSVRLGQGPYFPSPCCCAGTPGPAGCGALLGAELSAALTLSPPAAAHRKPVLQGAPLPSWNRRWVLASSGSSDPAAVRDPARTRRGPGADPVRTLPGRLVSTSLRRRRRSGCGAVRLNFKGGREPCTSASPRPAHTCVWGGWGRTPPLCPAGVSPGTGTGATLGRSRGRDPQSRVQTPRADTACTHPGSGQGGRYEGDFGPTAVAPGARASLTNGAGNGHVPASTLALHAEADDAGSAKQERSVLGPLWPEQRPNGVSNRRLTPSWFRAWGSGQGQARLLPPSWACRGHLPSCGDLPRPSSACVCFWGLALCPTFLF